MAPSILVPPRSIPQSGMDIVMVLLKIIKNAVSNKVILLMETILMKVTFLATVIVSFLIPFQLTAQHKSWMITGFKKQDSVNPCLYPAPTIFLDPVTHKN